VVRIAALRTADNKRLSPKPFFLSEPHSERFRPLLVMDRGLGRCVSRMTLMAQCYREIAYQRGNVSRRLVATALLARDRATVVPFDRGSHHAAVSPRANRHAARANADGGVAALPRNHVVVKHSVDSDCVGRPVAKCREAPLLFSAVNPRSQDRRARRYRRGACRGS
jgi:hypothetical protein